MAYSDQKYYTRVQLPVASSLSLSTATASGAISSTNVFALPNFLRRTRVNDIQLIVRTIPNAASTAMKLSFLNGTSTFGTAILTTATVNQKIDGVVTSTSDSIFAADAGPTITLTGTATASGAANGVYDILFEVQELFA